MGLKFLKSGCRPILLIKGPILPIESLILPTESSILSIESLILPTESPILLIEIRCVNNDTIAASHLEGFFSAKKI